MQNRIIISIVLLSFLLTLTNCGTVYQSNHNNDWFDSSPSADILTSIPSNSLVPFKLSQSPAPSNGGWQRLMEIGPGSEAIITLRDNTLRGGEIIKVTSDSLDLISAGQFFSIARTDIALVEVQGTSGTLAGGLIGFLVGGIALTAILFGDEEVPVEGWILGTALLGIPTGLVGALIGSQTGGDEKIVP